MMLLKNAFQILLAVIFLSVFLLFASCCAPLNLVLGNVSQGSSSNYDPDLVVTYDEDIAGGLPAAGSRNFRMGFTPFPYEYTNKAVEFTYANVNYHSDIVIHHFDNGVPWDESLDDKKLPGNINLDLNSRISKTGPGKDIYLALTPLSTYREGLAGYWGESENMGLPEEWKHKSFDDPDVIKAFLNYCIFMVDRFDPEYLAYGIEVNMLGYHDPAAFEDYLVFLASVYPSLKSLYPHLPIFLTIQLETFNNNFDTQKYIMEALLPYTDYIAISTYPFGNFLDPGDIPADWFSRLYDMAPEKPLAVTETSFPAQDQYQESYGRTIKGNEEGQLEYMRLLFESMSVLDLRFLTWFVIRDYDQLWKVMEENNTDEIFKSWRDTGLIDEKGGPRPALGYWDRWLEIPHNI
jgi:hypothetical protein